MFVTYLCNMLSVIYIVISHLSRVHFKIQYYPWSIHRSICKSCFPQGRNCSTRAEKQIRSGESRQTSVKRKNFQIGVRNLGQAEIRNFFCCLKYYRFDGSDIYNCKVRISFTLAYFKKVARDSWTSFLDPSITSRLPKTPGWNTRSQNYRQGWKIP